MYKLFPAAFILFGSVMFYANDQFLWAILTFVVAAILTISAFRHME